MVARRGRQPPMAVMMCRRRRGKRVFLAPQKNPGVAIRENHKAINPTANASKSRLQLTQREISPTHLNGFSNSPTCYVWHAAACYKAWTGVEVSPLRVAQCSPPQYLGGDLELAYPQKSSGRFM